MPGKTNLSYEELGFNIIKRYNRYISNFGDRTLIREFVAKSNDEIVRVYEHSGVEIESISLRDVKNRETEIRQEFIVHLDTLFRGNRVQKENEFQNAIIASLEKNKFYSVDYIPSRGKNKGTQTTLYYYGFMVQVGLITEGNKKAATETGRALGRAYTSKITDEVDRIWKEIIAEVDFLNRMLSAVRIRNGMDRSSFINHIIYSSGLKDTKESRAGAGALIEIFKSVGVLLEVDGKLTVPDDSSCTKPSATSNSVPVEQLHPEIVAQQTHPATISTGNSIVINININCTPADLDGLGDKISQLLHELAE